MSESSTSPDLNSFFVLTRAQRTGIQETLTPQGKRILTISDPAVVEVHMYLSENQCPVFDMSEAQVEGAPVELIIPEGARDVRTLISQPMDALQRRDVLHTIGETLRVIYDHTGQIPVGPVTDTLAVAFQAETGVADIYLVPPYSIAQPDPRTLTPELFTNEITWQDHIWEGWSNV